MVLMILMQSLTAAGVISCASCSPIASSHISYNLSSEGVSSLHPALVMLLSLHAGKSTRACGPRSGSRS